MTIRDSDGREKEIRVSRGRVLWGGKLRSRTSYTSGTRGSAVRPARCTTIIRYQNLQSSQGKGSLAAHLRYITRASASLPGANGPRVYGPGKLEDFARPLPGEKRFFKIVASPESFFGMDGAAFCEAFVARLQRAAGLHGQGQVMDWVAVAHGDTRNPHFHFVIRGLDTLGQDVFFKRKVVRDARLFAEGVQEIVSGGLPVEAEDDREFGQSGRIGSMPTRDGLNLDQFLLSSPIGATYAQSLAFVPLRRRRACHGRFRTLSDLGLLELGGDGTIAVAPDALERFREAKQVARALDHNALTVHSDPRRLLLPMMNIKPRYGIVTRIVKLPDGTEAAILETLGDETCLVPLAMSEIPELQAGMVAARLVRLRRGRLEVLTEEPKKRLAKLRARGRVATAILDDWRPASVDVEFVSFESSAPTIRTPEPRPERREHHGPEF